MPWKVFELKMPISSDCSGIVFLTLENARITLIDIMKANALSTLTCTFFDNRRSSGVPA